VTPEEEREWEAAVAFDRTWHCEVCGYINEIGFSACQNCGCKPTSDTKVAPDAG
jgi:hypothetical protein